MNQIISDADNYVYIVYGIVPEFMPRIAYCREKHFKTENKKLLNALIVGVPLPLLTKR